VALNHRLLTLLRAPPDHYTRRISVPGRQPRALIVAHDMVEHAETNLAALRALRGR